MNPIQIYFPISFTGVDSKICEPVYIILYYRVRGILHSIVADLSTPIKDYILLKDGHMKKVGNFCIDVVFDHGIQISNLIYSRLYREIRMPLFFLSESSTSVLTEMTLLKLLRSAHE